MRSTILTLSTLLLVMLSFGCSSAYKIERIEDQWYLEFSKGDDVKVGDIFVLYTRTAVYRKLGRPTPLKYKKTIVARVQVAKIADEKHAVVTVLEGQIEQGLKAERIQDGD